MGWAPIRRARWEQGRIVSTVLQLKNVSKRYGGVAALRGIDLNVAANSYVTLLGPSGSGKSTLLRVICGFEAPDTGSISFEGKPVDSIPAHRRGIGFVFQNFALFPHLTVERNISFGLENRQINPVTDAKACRARARQIMDLVGLTGLGGRGINQISGGQRQRVALARTLITEPRLVLLDEPLGALDANLRARMRTELRAIRERLGISFLHVTGNESEALGMGDTVVVLDRGAIGQIGNPDTIYNRPVSPVVAKFLNCYNLFAGHAADQAFATSHGRFPMAGASISPAMETEPAYAIRYDRIDVRPLSAAASDDEVRIEGAFVASEYTGASILSFFALPDGKVIEVESHLSRRAPAAYEPQARYSLVWNREAALVFV
jgi:ABC-type Fe3+/spermidine/putrescine transport system ATPase subunit